MRGPLLIIVLAAGCDARGTYSELEWSQLTALGDPGDPPADHSNKVVGDPAAERLGQMLYFDTQFSGPAQYIDMLGRPTTVARTPLGMETGIACATCHQPDGGGGDHTSVPRHVSIGAGAYDVNGQQTLNAAFQPLLYWNGRVDSLWSQALAVVESDVSMGGDRLKVLWRLADGYRAAYDAAFPEWPLPAGVDSVAAQRARLEDDGTCKLVAGACPADRCHEVDVNGGKVCLPRFPLRGKPGYEGQIGFVDEGTFRRCQRGGTTFPAEPFDDAFDCMGLQDQKDTTRIFVNFAKAIAAYEYKLVSRDSAFDRFVGEGPESDAISPSAARGAKLFVGKAACVDCHSGPLFSDGKFHDVGVPQEGAYVPALADCPKGGWCDCVSDDTNQPNNCLPWGFRDGLRKLAANRFRRDSFYSDDEACRMKQSVHNDPGNARDNPGECDGRVGYYSRLRVEPTPATGAWRTPSLRDVAQTGPYMHNGVYATLEEVVWHYSEGNSAIAALHLSEDEVADLVEFLKTLDGAPLPAELTHAPALPARTPF